MHIEINGITYYVEIDEPSEPDAHDDVREQPVPLLLLHGFTGSANSWQSIRPMLASRRVIRVDLIGHARTSAPADPQRYRMERAVDDLTALLDRLAIDRVDLLGYSMGARLALHIGLAAPQRLRRLVLEGGTYGIASPEERAQRVANDHALAERIEREGVEAFIRYWETIPLFATQATLAPHLREGQRYERAMHTARGLANSLRGMGTGAQTCLLERLPELSVPTLLIAGQLDTKFVALARQMHEAIGPSRLEIIAGAGHNVHLEQPEAFCSALLHFLSE